VTKGCKVQDAAMAAEFRGFTLRRLRIPVGGGVVSVVVPDAAAWRRDGTWVAGVVRGGEPPYWTRVWLAAVAAARLLARSGDLGGLEVCDIGCGLGIPGIVAASRGATVTFADQEAGALAFAGWNGLRQARAAPPRVQQLDWATEDLAGRFQVMVLADVTYRALHHAPLLRQIERGLADGGVVVHADPQRDESAVFLGRLRERLEVGVSLRATAFGEQSGEVRLSVAAARRETIAAWFARSGLDREWRPMGS
jgi:predicted nicotinamide N-methyase